MYTPTLYAVREGSGRSHWSTVIVATLLTSAPFTAALRAQPVYWDPAVGGNGHYYEVISAPAGMNWWEARLQAAARGGSLATIASAAENNFVHGLAAARTNLWLVEGTNSLGPWLGGWQPEGSTEPAGGWTWITGEPWTFTNWRQLEPNNSSGTENALHYFGAGPTNRAATWNDINALPTAASTPRGYTLEIDLGNPADLTVKEAADDFSADHNPNPPWSYGWASDLDAALIPFTESASASGLQIWRRPGYSAPAAVFNPTTADVQTGTPRFAAGEFHLQPGAAGEFAVLRFTAPVTGLYEVNAAFEGADTTGGTSTDARVRAGTNQIFQGTVAGFGSASRRSFRTAVSLAAGTSLDFAVGPAGSDTFDSTLVQVQIRYRRTFQGTLGAIDYPGDQDTYGFHLAAPATLCFDAQSSGGTLNWTLTGPPGVIVNGLSFNSSDGDSIADPVLRLPPGDYTLLIRETGDATGPYQFALLDFADATLIQPGTTNGNPTFAPRTTDLYQFTASSGDVITFDRLTALNGGLVYWRLVDPYGRVSWRGYFNDVDDFVLPATGTYTLLVESLIGGSSATSYSFRLVQEGSIPPPTFTGTPITFGSTVSNLIATAGGTNAFTFSLPQKSFLYFDSLIYDSNLRYTLFGPGGTMANIRSFSGGGAAKDLHEAPAGDYQLVISGVSSYTGPFAFRLHDLSNARPVTPGFVVTATNSPSSSLTAFRFSATPGTRLFLDALNQSGFSYWGNCYWTLIDPYGNILFGDAGFADRVTTLTGNGTYTLCVAGADQETGLAGTFSFKLVPVTETSIALALNTEYSGTIGSPGQRQLYTFSLAERKRVYFQSLTNESLVRWSLEGPSGVVAAQAFNASGWLAYTLEPGDYRLSVFANGDDTGGYSFKIVDFATSIPTPIGSTINGTLAPARSVVIRDLELNAGDQLYFDALSQSGFPYWGNPYWRIEDPEGNTLGLPELSINFDRAFGDLGPFTVQRTATYRLLIGGNIQEPGAIGNYSFRIHRVTNSTETIPFNQTVQTTIDTPGQVRLYNFTLASPARIMIDHLQTASNLRWMLSSPDRVYAGYTAFSSSGWHLLELPAGLYQLTVSAAGDDTGSFPFRLLELQSAALPMALNTDISTTFVPTMENKVFKFTAQLGQRVYFDMLTYSNFTFWGNPYWLLLSPLGETVFDAAANDRGPIVLPETGEYRLIVSGHQSEGAPTAFARFRVNDAPIQSQPLALDLLTTGALTVPGQLDRFTFTVNESTSILMDSRSNSPLRWTLSGPAGNYASRAFNSSDSSSFDSFLALSPGEYQMDVTGSGDDTGGYAFLVRTLASAEPIALNSTFNGTLNPASATRLFRFTATAGDRIRLQALSETGLDNAYWRLRDPAGEALWAGYFGGSTHSNQVDRTGTFTLQLEGNITEPGTGSFSFSSTTFTPNPPPPPTGTPIALGQSISNSLPTAASVHSYVFTLTQPTRLFLDYLRPLDYFSWALLGPDGPVYRMHSVNVALPVRTLPAGSYELQWTGVAAPYAFRLLNVDPAPLLSLGTTVTNRTTPSSGASFYRVPLAANQLLYFDLISESGFSSSPSKWLQAPAGHNEFSVDNADAGPFTPSQSGEHILFVDGPWASLGATGTVVFALNSVVQHTNAASFGAPLTGTLPAGGGGADTWTFTLTETNRLFVDVLNTPTFLWEWSLSGPAGDETGYRSPSSTDGSDASNSSLLLRPGNYQLRVRSTTTQPSAYSLRLLRAADASIFNPGTTQSVSVLPGSGTALLRFNGVVGQQVYYDFLSQSGPIPTLRLYSPAGTMIQNQSASSDLDTFELPLTGEYIVDLEARYSETAAGYTNTFIYRPINHVTNSIGPDQLVSGVMTTPGIRHVWNFTLATPQLIWVDVLTNAPGATWSLSRGLISLRSRSFTASDGTDVSDSVLRLPAGDYTLTIALGNNNSGSYAFRLVSQDSATPFAPGAPVAVTLDPPQATRVVTFSGFAGDRFFFDGLGHTGGGGAPVARLYAPNGELLMSRGVNDNEPTFTLPLTGSYFISVESRYSETGGPRTARFALIANPPKPTEPIGEDYSLPDLIVPVVTITPSTGLHSGDSLSVGWTVRNDGAVPTGGGFTDRVMVRNVTRNQILINTTVPYDPGAPGNGPIPAGGQRSRQIPVTLPHGFNGAGALEVVVTADTLNQIAENNPGGTGEANNSGDLSFTTTLSPYPDLQVSQLSANPPTNWAAGTPVQVAWMLTNSGPATAVTSWVDRVIVRNVSRSVLLLSSNVPHALPVDGPLSPGFVRSRSATFVVPAGANGQGEFEITIESDALAQVTEAQPDGSGETNNTALLTIRSAPNLQVLGLSVTPSPAVSGADLSVQWTLRNAGNAPVESSFSDRIVIRPAGGGAALVNTTAGYSPSTQGNGPIPPGATRTRSLNVRLPDGPVAVGTLQVEVAADAFNQVIELTALASGEDDNVAVTTLTTTLSPYPDLRATAVTVLPSSPQSGQEITVRWEDRNDGAAPTSGNWNDRVQILDASSGANIVETTIYQNGATLGPLAPNVSRLRQQTLRLPHGTTGSGSLRAVVTADSQNAVFEYNPAGNAESNNAGSITFTSTLAAYPDLAISAFQVTPGSFESGGQVSVTWSITNTGTGPVTGDFYDRLLVRNLSLASTILDQLYYFNPVADTNGPIAPGAIRLRSATFRLPDGPAAVGNVELALFLDSGNRIFEYRDSTDAEGNNITNVVRNSGLALYPDLAVSNVSAPATGLPGESIAVNWTVTNLGAAATPGGRNDQVYLVDDANPAAAQLLATIRFDSPVAAGASSNLSQLVPLPYFTVGSRRLAVRANAGPAFYELNQTNNYAAASVLIQLSPRLELTLNRESALETGSSNTVSLTVLRNGGTAADLNILLTSTAPELAAAPPTVTIPAGQTSRTVPVTLSNNGLVDGARSVRLTGTAAGYSSEHVDLTVLDDDNPILTFQTSLGTVDEDAGNSALTGTIQRNGPTNSPLLVTLTSDAPGRLLPPASVTIPAGARSVTFPISAPPNSAMEGDGTVRLQSTAPGYATATATIVVRDNDIPRLSLTLAAGSISEGSESPATTAVLSRQSGQGASLLVALNQLTPGLLLIPPQLTFPAGQASVTFNVNVTDDNLVNGTRIAQLIARPIGAAGVPVTNGQAVAALTVFDNDGPTLTVSLASDVVNENGSVTGTVTRNTGTSGSLAVSLASSDPGEASPASPNITIPNGSTSAPFMIQGVPDGVNDGIQQVLITAAAPAYNSATARLNVSDIDLPDLSVGDIIVPSSGQIDARANVTFTVVNSGPVAASGTWIDRVFISNDNQLGGDILAGSVTNSGPFGPGSSYTRTVSITLPPDPSRYHIIVVADVHNQVIEGNERNNVISVATIDVQPNYRASVETDIVTAPCGTAVPIRGRAFNPEDNSAARFKFVTVRVRNGGTRRLLNAVTDADGAFHLTFTPLPNETGDYQLAADHPRVNEDTPQDNFSLLGFGAGAEAATMTLIPHTPISGEIALRNMTSVPLTGITAVASNAPAALGLQLQVPSTLPGRAFATLAWSMNTTITNAARVVFPVDLTSAEGCRQRVLFTVNIAPLRPQLVAEPSFLDRGMVRGAQTLVTFTLRNIGGVDSGPLDLLPPPSSWLTLAGTNRLDSLAPGASTSVSLLLNPPADLPLAVYPGAIGVGNGQVALSVPFRFRAVSTAVGDLRVTATDDYTYYVAGSPRLTNAPVSVIDPYGGMIVTNGVTDASGEVRFVNLPEGAYTIEVTAPKHNTFRGTATIQPGAEAALEAFLARQTVSYRWSVVPLEIQDRYKIVLESVFETEVPIPNVIVEEPYIMPLVFEGETNQFEIALRNEGLIAAENVELIVPNHPDFRIEPLVRKIGTVPAKSRLTIPVLISKRVGGFAPASADIGDSEPFFQPAGEGCELDTAPCLPKIPLGVHYYYVCGNNGVLQQRSIDLSPVCMAKSIKECIEKTITSANSLHSFRNGGNAANFACDLLEAVLQCAGVELSPCQSAALSIACGALTGGVAGAAGGAGSGSSLECICGLIKNLNISLPPSSPNYGTVNYFNGSLIGSIPGGFNGYPWSAGYLIGPGSCSSPSVSPASSSGGPLFSPASGGVCARVRLQIDQEAVLTRVAFKGSLEIDNDSGNPITGIRLTLDMRDINGLPAGDRFVVRPPVVSGLGNVDGTGTVAAFGTGSAEYLFIPTRDAAPDAPSVYRIGGSLRYLDGGQEVVVPLSSATITVYPEARLQLHYFQSRNVFSDDPFTPETEPTEPFALGLLARNVGAGDARNFRITSAQPKIIENEKGLLIDFKIIGSQVGSNSVEPSLTVQLGTIPAGRSQVAQWLMTSTLQGKFIEYKATFEHVDNFGSTNLSLIDSVEIHELIHPVLTDRPGDDRSPDFLANDIPDADSLPDILHLSDGSTAQVESRTAGSFSNPIGSGSRQTTLTVAVPAGWVYVELPDPGPGWRLHRVVRSDNKSILVGTNAWTTDRTFPSSQSGSQREYRFHLLDYNSTGSYTLFYRPVDTSAPALVSLGPVLPALQTSAVGSVDVVFTEEIDPTTLNAADLTLTLNDGPNRITGAVTFTQIATNKFTIGGLAALTAADGNYKLTINAAGISDFAGNAGQDLLTATWAKGALAPVVTSLGPIIPNPRNTPVSDVEVVFSRAIDDATFTPDDLVLTRGGGANLVNSGVAIQIIDTNRFLITGLATLTQLAGDYRLTVLAAGVEDTSGTPGTGIQMVAWSTATTGPQIVTLEQPVTNPRNIVVASLDVTFAAPINPASFDWQDLQLTRDGGANLVTSAVTVQPLSPTVYRLANFTWVIGAEGRYVFTVSAAGIVDLAGNPGSGSATAFWTMDTTRPPTPTGLTFAPDAGVSSTDGLINTLTPTLSGTLGETNLTLRVRNLTTGTDYGPADVTGLSFSKALTLGVAGAHKLEVHTVDAAGNASFPQLLVDLFADLTLPAAEISPVFPSLRSSPVDFLTVIFSEAINPATLTRSALSLRRQNGANLINPGVQIVNVASNQYRVTGLTPLTDTAGSYEFALNMAAVQDRAGNSGSNVVSATWSRTGANLPPTLAFLPDRTAKVGSTIVITNVASDPDAGQSLRFSLNQDAPANIRLGETSGVFRWSPTRSQSPGLYAITITVTDDGVPPASTSRTFTVAVDEFTETSLGEAVLLAGETGTVPLALVSTAGLTNLLAEVTVPAFGLTPPQLGAISPLIASSTLQDLGLGRYRVSLVSQPGQSIRGSNILANLHFGTTPDQSSAFLSLPLSNITARQPDGTAVATTFTRDGRVIVIGEQPLLELVGTGGSLRLRLFAREGDAYELESAPVVTGAWETVTRVRFTGREMNWLPPVPTGEGAMEFYRLAGLDVSGPFFEITGHDAGGMDVIFYGERGRTFDLQTTGQLGGTWNPFQTQSMTNMFQEFRLEVPPGETRFLRAREH